MGSRGPHKQQTPWWQTARTPVPPPWVGKPMDAGRHMVPEGGGCTRWHADSDESDGALDMAFERELSAASGPELERMRSDPCFGPKVVDAEIHNREYRRNRAAWSQKREAAAAERRKYYAQQPQPSAPAPRDRREGGTDTDGDALVAETFALGFENGSNYAKPMAEAVDDFKRELRAMQYDDRKAWRDPRSGVVWVRYDEVDAALKSLVAVSDRQMDLMETMRSEYVKKASRA